MGGDGELVQPRCSSCRVPPGLASLPGVTHHSILCHLQPAPCLIVAPMTLGMGLGLLSSGSCVQQPQRWHGGH